MAIIPTTEQWRKAEGLKIVQQVRADIRNRRDWDAQRAESRAIYAGNVTRPDIHWEGATDIHLPVVYESIERLVPKMANAFWNVWPHVIVDRVPQEYDPEESRIQEHYINWAVEYDIEGFYGTTHSWFRNALIDGNSEVKTQWVTRWRKTCEVHRLKAYKRVQLAGGGVPQKPQLEPKSAQELLDELFGRGQWIPVGPGEENEYKVTIVEERRPIEGVTVRFTDNSQFLDEIEILVFRPILVEDRPQVQVVESENIVLPHRSRGIQSAKRVTHIHWMPLEDIKHEAAPERYDPWIISEEDWRTLEALSMGSEERAQESDNDNLAQIRDSVEGVQPTGNAHDTVSIRLYEVYVRRDIDGDGFQEEIVMQVSPDLQKVLHVTYLDTLHPHGRRPFAGIRFQTESDRYYVPGLAAQLAPLNIQANITLNQVNDRQTLVSNPFFFYRPMALPEDPDAITRIKPGDGIPTPDPGGIVFPSWGTSPLADMQIMDIALAFSDRIGVPPQFGGSNQSSNAPRTARGTLAILSEGNLKIDVLISLAQREGFQELMLQLFGLYSVYMSDEKYFWATGRDRVRRPEMISRRLLRGNFEFRFRGNTVNTNPEVQRTLSQIRYQVASTNPLYLQDPVKFRELLRDFLESHSDGTSVERILPDLPGMGPEIHAPMDQNDENTAIRLHRPVQALQSDNHLEHIAKIDALVQSPAFEFMDDVSIGMLAQHYISHQQFLARAQQIQRLAEPGAPASDGGGAGGAEQGIGLSELAGGVQ